MTSSLIVCGEAMKAVQFGNPAERNDIAMGR